MEPRAIWEGLVSLHGPPGAFPAKATSTEHHREPGGLGARGTVTRTEPTTAGLTAAHTNKNGGQRLGRSTGPCGQEDAQLKL